MKIFLPDLYARILKMQYMEQMNQVLSLSQVYHSDYGSIYTNGTVSLRDNTPISLLFVSISVTVCI